jgi:hypothetical protein
MLPIPPLASTAYAALQGVRQTEDRVEQVRRPIGEPKDPTNPADRYEHSVESSEEVQAIHDEEAKQQPGKNKHPHRQHADPDSDDTESHLDLTA